MPDIVLDMPTPKKNAKGRAGKKPFPSREKVKYVSVPRDYWDLVKSLTGDGEKYEGRSVAFLAKLALRAWLQAEGKVDEKGKPKA